MQLQKASASTPKEFKIPSAPSQYNTAKVSNLQGVASRTWKQVVQAQEELHLLQSLQSEGIGTREVEAIANKLKFNIKSSPPKEI